MGPLSWRKLHGVLLDLDEQTAAPSTGSRGAEVFANTPGPWPEEDPNALVAEVQGYLAEEDLRRVALSGAPELIRDWHRHGVPIGLVTAGNRSWAEYVVEEILGVRECFAVLVAREDVPEGKPDRAPFAVGCRALHVSPREAAAVADSVAGVTAAVAAGVGLVVGVATSVDGARLREVGAHRLAASFDELAAR
ncbi:MAG: HAD family hydrolase [Actinomycetota bacterium]